MNCPHVGRRCWATMRGMVAYTKAAVERAMQVRLVSTSDGKVITWWQAAEIIGISDRSMAGGSVTSSTVTTDCWTGGGAPSGRRVPLAQVEWRW